MQGDEPLRALAYVLTAPGSTLLGHVVNLLLILNKSFVDENVFGFCDFTARSLRLCQRREV